MKSRWAGLAPARPRSGRWTPHQRKFLFGAAQNSRRALKRISAALALLGVPLEISWGFGIQRWGVELEPHQCGACTGMVRPNLVHAPNRCTTHQTGAAAPSWCAPAWCGPWSRPCGPVAGLRRPAGLHPPGTGRAARGGPVAGLADPLRGPGLSGPARRPAGLPVVEVSAYFDFGQNKTPLIAGFCGPSVAGLRATRAGPAVRGRHRRAT